MNTLITICARGGSKGIPGKNVKLINGKPLIYYTLKIANEFALINQNVKIYLSTDSIIIQELVKELSFASINTDYNRPAQLATDSAGKMDTIKDVLKYAEAKNDLSFDYILDLDVTSPLRTIMDIENAFKKLTEVSEALNIFSVNPANRNPYFNMVELDKNGFAQLCKNGNFLTRQSAPKVYDMNASFYIYKSSFFKMNINSAITNKSLIYEMPHMCFDLDHPIDFEFMSYLLKNNKLDFKLLT
jgi:CMP-N-acetylneuraminic acid synthetase